MNAQAVQMAPSVASAASTWPGGSRCGQVRMAAGVYTSAARVRQAAVIGRAGTLASFRAAINGAVA